MRLLHFFRVHEEGRLPLAIPVAIPVATAIPTPPTSTYHRHHHCRRFPQPSLSARPRRAVQPTPLPLPEQQTPSRGGDGSRRREEGHVGGGGRGGAASDADGAHDEETGPPGYTAEAGDKDLCGARRGGNGEDDSRAECIGRGGCGMGSSRGEIRNPLTAGEVESILVAAESPALISPENLNSGTSAISIQEELGTPLRRAADATPDHQHSDEARQQMVCSDAAQAEFTVNARRRRPQQIITTVGEIPCFAMVEAERGPVVRTELRSASLRGKDQGHHGGSEEAATELFGQLWGVDKEPPRSLLVSGSAASSSQHAPSPPPTAT